MATIKKLVGLLAQASNATVAAAAVATIVALMPGVHVPTAALTGAITAVGTIAKVVEAQLLNSSAKKK